MAGAPDPTPSGMMGRKAPGFTLEDQDGKTHKPADCKGKRVVLYTNPKDDTPGFVLAHETSRPRNRWRRSNDEH